MGRRRYRKREEDSPFEQMLSIAFESAWAGGILAVVCMIIGLVLRANPTALSGLAPLIGALVLIVAALLAGIAVFGFIMRSGADMLTAIGSGIAALLTRRSVQRAEPPRGPRPGPRPQAAAAVVPSPAGSLLSRGERAFYDPLRDVVAGRFEVHVKPSLVDVLGRRDHADYKTLSTMHVDFLLCDPSTLRPLLAIELDDASHRTSRRAAVDRRKAELLREAGIPTLRQRCAAAYDVQALREQIDRAAR